MTIDEQLAYLRKGTVEVIREDEHTWRLGRGGSRFNFDFNDGKLVIRGQAAVSSN